MTEAELRRELAKADMRLATADALNGELEEENERLREENAALRAQLEAAQGTSGVDWGQEVVKEQGIKAWDVRDAAERMLQEHIEAQLARKGDLIRVDGAVAWQVAVDRRYDVPVVRVSVKRINGGFMAYGRDLWLTPRDTVCVDELMSLARSLAESIRAPELDRALGETIAIKLSRVGIRVEREDPPYRAGIFAKLTKKAKKEARADETPRSPKQRGGR